ncbi:hypothetical protein RI129_010104 [Pyrocoelia pectoralis]|uniref:Uncharacterized protein n=1 Tax=Pyrocoelia pectoralis TaxID=417401 RepID=A0AAN7ZGL2_9COLE
MSIKIIVLIFIYSHFVESGPIRNGIYSLIPTHNGYYWREFYGEVPPDADPGGRDRSGNPTYIGQVFGKDLGLLPATIVRGSPNVTTTWGTSAVQSDKNVKILCSNDQDKFKWIPTKAGDVHMLSNCHLVNGGYEGDYLLHIGRVNHEEEVIIGKVFSHIVEIGGLWIPYGRFPVWYGTYQILAFDCR